MPGTLHAVGVNPLRIAQSLSIMSFALPFGGTLGLAIMGSVFNNKFVSATYRRVGSGGNDLGSINDTPAEIQALIRERARDAVVWAYIAILPIVALGSVLSFGLGNVRITSDKLDDITQSTKEREDENKPVGKPYLLSFFNSRG